MLKENKITSFSNQEKNKYGLLGYKYVVKDLINIKPLHALLLILAGIFLLITSLFSIDPNFSSIQFFTNDSSKTTFQLALQGISGLVAFAGIVNVYLVGTGKVSNYTWGIVGVTTYGVYAFSVGYTGDAILNICFFMPFQFIGFKTWKNSMKSNEVIQTKMKSVDWAWSFLTFVALFTSFWFLIPVADEGLNKAVNGGYGGYPFDGNLNTWFNGQGYLAHCCDALTNALSIVASIWMFKKFKEQWPLWILINVIQFIMYTGLNGWGMNIPMLLMWGVYLVNAFYATFYWYKEIEVSNA